MKRENTWNDKFQTVNIRRIEFESENGGRQNHSFFPFCNMVLFDLLNKLYYLITEKKNTLL